MPIGSLSSEQDSRAESKRLTVTHEAALTKLEEEHSTGWRELEAEWRQRVQPIYETIRTAKTTAELLFPEWQMPSWEKWIPPQEFGNAAKFGRLDVDTVQLFETMPKDKRLSVAAHGHEPVEWRVDWLATSYLRQTAPASRSIQVREGRARAYRITDCMSGAIHYAPGDKSCPFTHRSLAARRNDSIWKGEWPWLIITRIA